MTIEFKRGVGSSFDDFLKEEGTYEETQAVAIKRVLAWQIEDSMKEQNISKAELARRMGTSREPVGSIARSATCRCEDLGIVVVRGNQASVIPDRVVSAG